MGEPVTVSTGGGRWTAFRSISIEAAVNEAARSLTFEVAAVAGAKGTNAIFANFAPLSVSAGGDLLFTGYIDRRRPRLAARGASMTVSARSKGQDAIDCSHDHETGRFEKKTPLDIAKALDIYGIGFTSKIAFEPIDEYHVTPGETVFREVERLCRDEGATLFGQADGGIELWNADAGMDRQGGAIVEGVNLFEGEADHDCQNRHSEKRVRGHQAKGTGKAAHAIEGVSKDDGVPRTRKHIRIHDGSTDTRRAQRRAQNHRDRSAGNGLRAEITMPGWRDSTGMLWTPGKRVWTQSPFLDLGQDMLIEKVHYEQDHSTRATLSLVDPRAYAGKGGGRNASGAEWGIGG